MAFAEAGATDIIFADRNDNGAREAAEQSQTVAIQSAYRYLVVHLDSTDPASVQSMVDAAVQGFGRIDYSVNCAGVTPLVKERWFLQRKLTPIQEGTDSNAPTADASVKEFDKLAEINTRGTMLCVRAVSKAMAKQEPLMYQGRHGQRSLGRGSIINITPVMSFIGARGKLP